MDETLLSESRPGKERADSGSSGEHFLFSESPSKDDGEHI
jgi:hypothetical protein